MLCTSVLTTRTRTMIKIQKYRVSFFFTTLIEELRVVKGLVTYGLGAD